MASEIRVNKINNRAGLGTITIADTGVVVNGIVTCTEVSGLNVLNIAGVSTFASTLDINGDIDVDGHTNLDNVSVAGVSTFAGNVIVNGGISNAQYLNLSALAPSIDFNDTNHNSDFMLQNANGLFKLYDNTNTADRVTVASNGNVSVKKDLDVDGHTNLDNVSVAGVITATSFRGDGSQLTGIVAGLTTISGVVNVANDLDVDGHTNLDNISVAGVSTFSGNANFTNPVSFGGDSLADVEFKNGNNTRVRFDVTENGLVFLSNSYLYFDQNGTVIYRTGQDTRMWTQDTSKNLSFGTNTEKLEVNNAGVNVAGIVSATSFSGDGSSLSNLPAGAPVGGASTNTVFFENDKAVAVNYQITSTKNAMSAGPIAINAGIAVTVPSGCSWTIV